jgi:hypothetical protein
MEPTLLLFRMVSLFSSLIIINEFIDSLGIVKYEIFPSEILRVT